MHDLLSQMHQNPGDMGVVKQMNQIASQNPRADLGSLVSQAGALHKQHLADMPPMVPDRSPARELEVQVAEEKETEGGKRAEPDVVEPQRSGVRSLADVLGDKTYAEYTSKRDQRIYDLIEKASTETTQFVSKEADADKVERQAVIAKLPSTRVLDVLDEDSLQTRLKLWDAQKRKENRELAAKLGDIESESAVTA